jgi:prepilin-type processing-associated H-X9-DG protein
MTPDTGSWTTYGMAEEDGSTTASLDGTYLWDSVGMPLARITEPARTFMIVESVDYRGNPHASTYDSNWSGTGFPTAKLHQYTASPEDSPYFAYDRHFDGSNVAFADGHVKWIKAGEYTNWRITNRMTN